MKRTLRPLFAVAVSTLLFSPLFAGASATASAATVPECAYANITVSVGTMYHGSGAIAGTTRLIPVYFKNRGAACHLPLTGPAFIAFHDAKLSKKSTVTQDARPAVWGGQKYVVLASRSRNKAVVQIAALSSSAMKSRACGAQTANGFLIESFGLPVAKWIYFAQSLPGVCFYSGAAPITTNVKLTWAGLK
jgi:hypothetical protein